VTAHTHQTAPTQYVEANGIRFAYRRFGKAGRVPLVFNQHFTGTLNHWDPAVTDGFAKDREVILFNNAGISSTSGDVPTSIEKMAANAAAFIKALRLAEVDVLGFSLRGRVAQELAIADPKLVRRPVLVGTGPRSGEGMASLTPEAQRVFGATYENADDLWLGVFFTPSAKSQAAGREYLKRFRLALKIATQKSAIRSRRPRSRRSGNGERRAKNPAVLDGISDRCITFRRLEASQHWRTIPELAGSCETTTKRKWSRNERPQGQGGLGDGSVTRHRPRQREGTRRGGSPCTGSLRTGC
jgi:pimeloyl-ACP methyl ester carboxylesterase